MNNNSSFMNYEFGKAVLASIVGGIVVTLIQLIFQWIVLQ